jgi:hypothetical protein
MKRTSWARYDGGGVTLRLRTQSLVLSRGAMWVSHVFESWGYKRLRKAFICSLVLISLAGSQKFRVIFYIRYQR